MIKIRLRKNLLYLLVYYISWYARKILDIIIGQIFDIYPSYIYLYLMVLGEIIGGLSLYLYQFTSWKKKKQTKYFGISLIHNRKRKIVRDKHTKRYLLILLASFFDFFEFIIGSLYVPIINPNISSTIEARLGYIQTIASSLICTYALEFKTKRHHKVSIIVMCSCLLLTICSYEEQNKSIRHH